MPHWLISYEIMLFIYICLLNCYLTPHAVLVLMITNQLLNDSRYTTDAYVDS